MSLDRKKVIFIATLPPPVTGESLVNKLLFEDISTLAEVYSINGNLGDRAIKPGSISFLKIFSSLFWMFSSSTNILFRNFDAAYIVSGQTRMGIFRFLPLIWLCKLKCSNVVVHFHGSLAAETVSSLPWMIKKIIEKVFSTVKVVVLADLLKESHSAFFRNITVVNNFVPVDSYTGVVARIDRVNEGAEVNCLFMSNLLPEKGIVETVSSICKLLNHHYQINLTICGGGSDAAISSLRELIKKESRINYVGVVEGEEKYEILARSHIFILPTYYPIEGMPISLLEAARFENIVISTNQGAISEFVENGITGYICEKKSVDSLFLCIKKIIENSKQQSSMLDSAKKKVDGNYEQSTFLKKMRRLILNESNPT